MSVKEAIIAKVELLSESDLNELDQVISDMLSKKDQQQTSPFGNRKYGGHFDNKSIRDEAYS